MRPSLASAAPLACALLLACGGPPPPQAEAGAAAPGAGADAPGAGAAAPGSGGPAGEVAFDHSVHARESRMPCLDCHAYADRSPVAGIPSGRKCMGCHKLVAKDKPGVKLLAARFEAGEPLRWRRVFALPDFVYFSHRVHVRAKVECAACHGDVASEKVVRQDRPFTMGRCLSCHEERKASRDCLACHK